MLREPAPREIDISEHLATSSAVPSTPSIGSSPSTTAPDTRSGSSTSALAVRSGVAAQDLFRAEALRELERAREGGPVLRLAPRWTEVTWWALVATVVTSVAFATFARVGEYASGPALVRFAGHAPVAARVPGTVEEVLVRTGDPVEAGQALVRLWSGAEEHELARATAEFEVHLTRLLLDPANEVAHATAAAARPAVDVAHVRLEGRIVRAPRAGRVGAVRVRPGEAITAGDPLVSVVSDTSGLEVVALLPGHHRPLLSAGILVRLEVTGYPQAYLEVRAQEGSGEIFGPAAVRRFLGDDSVDAMSLGGPVTMLRAALPAGFEADGREWPFFPGMWLGAEARIRDEPLLLALVPGLRAATDRLR